MRLWSQNGITIVIMKCYSAYFIKQLVLHKVSQRMHEVSQR